MKIANEFTVNASLERSWEILNDLDQVVPLMPGAQLTELSGDDFKGRLKVKVGPVTSEFSGQGHFVERDEDNHRAVVEGKGRESRGSGNASAVVTMQCFAEGNDKTRVTVDTDLKIVGKLAQFGSGMLQQVSEKLLGQFVTGLEAKLGGAEPQVAAAAPASEGAAPAGATAARPVAQQSEPEALDLAGLVGPVVVKRYAPIAVAVVAVLLLVVAVARRRR